MRKINIDVMTVDGKQKTLAFTDERCAGLAVHRSLCEPHDGELGDVWTVSHVASGKAVLLAERSVWQAIARAIILAEMADFSQPELSSSHSNLARRYVAWRVRQLAGERELSRRCVKRAIESLGISNLDDDQADRIAAWINEHDPERESIKDMAIRDTTTDVMCECVAQGEVEMYAAETDDGFSERFRASENK